LLCTDFENCASLGPIIGTVKKFFARRGAYVLFCGIWNYGVKVIEFQSFYELKKKLLLLLLLYCIVATTQGTLL